MSFGERLRELRKAKGLTLRDMAAKVGVGFTYRSRVETGRMTYGDYPGRELIGKLAKALEADEDELLLLAEKTPEPIRRRVLQRPDAFRKFASLDDATLDGLLAQLGETPYLAATPSSRPGNPSPPPAPADRRKRLTAGRGVVRVQVMRPRRSL